MAAVNTKLTVEQGADWSHGWLVRFNGEPIDETWTARSQVRRTKGASAVLHEFGAEVTPEGAVVIAAGAAESSGWEWSEGVYDVEVESPGGVVLRVSKGRVEVDREVTR